MYPEPGLWLSNVASLKRGYAIECSLPERGHVIECNPTEIDPFVKFKAGFFIQFFFAFYPVPHHMGKLSDFSLEQNRLLQKAKEHRNQQLILSQFFDSYLD